MSIVARKPVSSSTVTQLLMMENQWIWQPHRAIRSSSHVHQVHCTDMYDLLGYWGGTNVQSLTVIVIPPFAQHNKKRQLLSLQQPHHE